MESQEVTEQSEVSAEVPAFMKAPDETPCADQSIESRVEAVLLSISRPLSETKLVDMLGLGSASAKDKMPVTMVKQAIDHLNTEYAQSGRSFRIERLAGGWQLLTLSKFGPLLTRVHGAKLQGRLTPAALDTLAIIAYRQPTLRSELEAVRGVACGDVLRGLMERRLVRITGRAEELGRPMLYGTTSEFLRVFGISRIEDLPQARELRNPAG
ncbi:MAG: SMC-Scp complex subunit ScpB [Planctomycetota bacterium]|jgi:segregation and condensation protein B|nr:MAG: SMC-Scp complex subunit ScpB [Planctomycetota bacterium]